MSLGSSGSSDGNDVVSQAVNRAAEMGIVPVVAAGNSGPAPYTIGTPAAAEKAITVAAMADVSELGFGLAAFSGRGPTRDGRIKPNLTAPGVNMTAPRAGSTNQYVAYSGTSMATPFAAGAIALMLAANPALTVEQVRSILHSTAADWGAPGSDVDYGWGRLDVHAAVRQAGNFARGNPPAVPQHVRLQGSLGGRGEQAEHPFTVGETAYPLNLTLIMPDWSGSSSPDFDLYLYDPDGAEIARAIGTNRQEQIGLRVSRTGTYRAAVRAYAGSGDYLLDLSGGLGEAPDLPPQVQIDEPAEDQVLSGRVTIKVRAGDDRSVSRVELAVSSGPFVDITGSYDGSHYRFELDTTTLPNGQQSLTARATDSAGQQAEATRRVRVANGAEGEQHEITRTGIVSAQARDLSVEVIVHQPGYIDLSLSWTTRADLDFYVYAPDGSYVGRAYTLNNPEQLRVDTARWGTGTYRIRVNLYSGADSAFTLTAKGYLEVLFTGSVTPGARDVTHYREVPYTGRGRAVLAWPGSSDLDLFVYDPMGRERARGYTLLNPERVDVEMQSVGRWSIRVNLYAGSAVSYQLRSFVPETVLS